MNQQQFLLKFGFFVVALIVCIEMCRADIEDIGQGGGGFDVNGNAEEGRFLGLLKKGKGRVETHTNYVPYPYPVPVPVPVYQNVGHGGKFGFGKGLLGQSEGLADGFGQGYYPGYYPYQQNSNYGYGGAGAFGNGYGYFKR